MLPRSRITFQEAWEKTLYMMADGHDRNTTRSRTPNKVRDPRELLLHSDDEMSEGDDSDFDSDDRYGSYEDEEVWVFIWSRP